MRTRPCTCCSHIDGRVPGPAIAAWWSGPNGLIGYLCKRCLDIWFDAGDEDDDLEPDAVYWLDGSARRLVKGMMELMNERPKRKPKIMRLRHVDRWMLDWPKEDGTTMRRAHYRTWQDAMDDCAYLYKRHADPFRII